MPVHVERQVRLLGRNLHLFQVSVSVAGGLVASQAVAQLYTSPREQEEGLALSPQPGALLGAPGGLTGPSSPPAAPPAVSSAPRTAQETMSA